MYRVLYYDRSSAQPDELLEYCVEAYDQYDAERQFKVFARGESFDIYCIGSDECESDPDAHSCRAEANEYGICTVCGAIVSGSSADYELHGYDPPGTY